MEKGFITKEIDKQNKSVYHNLPSKYKHIMDRVIVQISSKFSFLEIVKNNMNDTQKLKQEITKMLEKRNIFLQEIRETFN